MRNCFMPVACSGNGFVANLVFLLLNQEKALDVVVILTSQSL